MGHTAASLEGALYEILEIALNGYFMVTLNPFQENIAIQDLGLTLHCAVSIHMDGVEWYKINTLAALTNVQVVHFHIDIYGWSIPSVSGDPTGQIDSQGILVSEVWAAIVGLTEAANAGDIGWANITNVQILNVGPITTSAQETPFRRVSCVALWN